LDRGLAKSNRIAILSNGRIVYQAHRTDLDVGSFRRVYQEAVSG
jgi:ABC-type phosphate/phosphonate transport system ATPase subunit